MNKEQALRIIKLLSALESWGFAAKERIPNWLHEDLQTIVDELTEEMLK